jgi:hypothetical protein
MKEELKEGLVKFIKWYWYNPKSNRTAGEVVDNYINSLKTKLEVGKWYVLNNYNKTIAFNINGYDGYGFSNGTWSETPWSFEDSRLWRPATDKEVEESLISEAKRRGFKKDVNFNTALTNEEKYARNGLFKYCADYNFLSLDGSTVFYKGKWAEIIKKPKELTLEEIAEKFGVNVEQIKIKK